MGVAGFDGWRSWEITLEGCFLSEELIPWRYVREKLGCKDGFSECSILSRCKQMFGFLRLLGGGWPKIGRNSSLEFHNSGLFGRHRTRIEPRPRPPFTAALKKKKQ